MVIQEGLLSYLSMFDVLIDPQNLHAEFERFNHNHVDKIFVLRSQIYDVIEAHLNPNNITKEAQDLQNALELRGDELNQADANLIFANKYYKSLILESFIEKILDQPQAFGLKFLSPPSAQDKEWITRLLVDDFLYYGPVTTLFLEPLLSKYDHQYKQNPVAQLLRRFVDNKRVIEIRINSASEIFFEAGNQVYRWPVSYISNLQLRIVIERIISETNAIANASVKLNASSPIADFEHVCGYVRGAAVIPPASESPMLTLRVHPGKSYTLDDLRSFGMFDRPMQDFMVALQRAGATIAIAGTMGSGKTTLLSALAEIWPEEGRKATIEDTPELKPAIADLVKLRTIDYQRDDIKNIDVTRLTKACKRHSVRYVVLSEARDGSAWEILQLSQAILGCLMTFHYTLRSSKYLVDQALNTLVALSKQHPCAPDGNDIKHLIASMVQILILVEQSPLDNLRRISKIYYVTGYDEFNGGHFKATELFAYLPGEGFALQNVSKDLEEYLANKGVTYKFQP